MTVKAPISTFSRTVISGNRLWAWGTCEIPGQDLPRREAGDGLTAERISPWRGRRRPLIVAISVDLPAPLGPTTQ